MLRSTPREFVAARLVPAASGFMLGNVFIETDSWQSSDNIAYALGRLIEDWERHKQQTTPIPADVGAGKDTP